MNESSRAEGRRAEEIFAEFLDRQKTDPARDFESWVAAHTEDEAQLRRLYEAFRRITPHLPADSPAQTEHLASESLERGYEVLGELGRGGYGRVFRARDRVLRREVALKVLAEDEAAISADTRRRFLEEARVLAQLDHPNIVRIHSVENDGGEIRLSLELVEGRTLQEVVEQDGPFSSEEAARIGIDVCRALAAIHGEGLIHMDVKPGNVMRAEGGRIVLLDFGFARRATEPGAGRSRVGGTPPFMSPEHFEGKQDIGPSSDLYSLGVLLYWLITGRYPYEYDDFAELSEKVLAGRATPLLDARPDASAELAEIIEQAMARDARQRFASAGTMEEALRRFVGGSKAVPQTEPTELRRSRLRSPLVAGFLVVLLAGAGFALRLLGEKPFTIDYDFYRSADGEPTALSDGDSVRVGDALYMRARSARPFYLYVFNQDEHGKWYRLVPKEAPALYGGNVWHRFPRAYSWVVNSVGDTEHLYVVASPHRVPFADALVEIIPPTGREAGQLDRGERDRLRSIGGETSVAEEPTRPFDLDVHFASFEQSLDEGSEVFTSHHHLRNEGE